MIGGLRCSSQYSEDKEDFLYFFCINKQMKKQFEAENETELSAENASSLPR